jgi:hypothetical protein
MSDELGVDLIKFVDKFHRTVNYIKLYQVYGYILNGVRKGYIYDTNTIINELGFEPKAVKRLLKILVKEGYITIYNDHVLANIKQSIIEKCSYVSVHRCQTQNKN